MFKRGDKVQHLTGGPVMLVVGVCNKPYPYENEEIKIVSCEWFSGEYFNQRTFDSDTVKSALPASPPPEQRPDPFENIE